MLIRISRHYNTMFTCQGISTGALSITSHTNIILCLEEIP
jgi:hypothetical protein